MKGFCSINPYATLIYFLSILLITMFISNPVIQAISLIGSLLLLWELSDVKAFFSDLLLYTLIFLLITITNPLFSHNGETPLFFLIGNPITFTTGQAVPTAADVFVTMSTPSPMVV